MTGGMTATKGVTAPLANRRRAFNNWDILEPLAKLCVDVRK